MPKRRVDRASRVGIVRELTRRGYSSREIGERLGIAPSTVRDYRTDPERASARIRQRKLAVVGVDMPEGGTPIAGVKPRWKRGAPHRGEGMFHARVRGRQMRAIIGWYHRHG